MRNRDVVQCKCVSLLMSYAVILRGLSICQQWTTARGEKTVRFMYGDWKGIYR